MWQQQQNFTRMQYDSIRNGHELLEQLMYKQQKRTVWRRCKRAVQEH